MSQAPSVDNTTGESNASVGSQESVQESPLEALERERDSFLADTAAMAPISDADEKAALKELEAQATAERAKQVQQEYGEEQPGADTTPPETPGTPEQEESEQAPEAIESAAVEGDLDQPEENSDGDDKSPQYRIRPRSERGKLQLQYLKQNPTMTEDVAWELAGRDIGADDSAPPQAAAKTAPAPETETRPEPIDLSKFDQELESLQQEQATAIDDYEPEKAKEVGEKIAALYRERAEAEVQNRILETETSKRQEADIMAQFEASEAATVAAYPQAADPNSAFARRMQEIDNAWESLDDPRFYNASKPAIIASMVASELNVAPRAAQAQSATPDQAQMNPPQTSTEPTPQAKRQAAPPPPMHPASSSTRAQSATSAPTLDQELDSVSTIEELEKFRDRHGIDAAL